MGLRARASAIIYSGEARRGAGHKGPLYGKELQLTVNGKPREAADNATILTFLESNAIDPRIVAVERNGEIVKRERWSAVRLEAGDTLEIVRMVGGG